VRIKIVEENQLFNSTTVTIFSVWNCGAAAACGPRRSGERIEVQPTSHTDSSNSLAHQM